ncbi:MAG: ABC transporter permease [Candidatus Latescibacteria bacterium]|nr:ABC transporter permease [Candidatus Latescibacterota bacterium]
MLKYIAWRILMMIPTLFAISIVSFLIIQLPPGDFLTSYLAQLTSMGETVSEEVIEALRARYGLGSPVYVQYWTWITGIISQGDFGMSLLWGRPVSELLWERVGLTVMVSASSVLFIWVVAIPIGIYSAVRQYSIGDYIFTFLGFLGLATPPFMLALIALWIVFVSTGSVLVGLFSPEYIDASWSFGKALDLLAHLWIPMVILGTAGTAGTIRVIRAQMLDELHKPYVVTARAKGVSELKLLFKYPVRIALNPFFSTLGWLLPRLIAGEILVSIVLNLPTTGPLLLGALTNQDMYLAGSFMLILSTLTVIGTLISDILLAWVDPRIRYS